MNRLAPMLLTAALLCLHFLAPGCAQEPTTAAGYGDPMPAPLGDPQISVLAEDLRPWLGFQPAVVVDDGEHPMDVQVPVRNLADRMYMIDYRIVFYDDAGREMSPIMGWTPTPLYPRETVRLTAKAMDTRARNYRLEVKWAR